MKDDCFIKTKEDLRQIANILLINGTLSESPGLLDGKIGIAVFFFHYARFTGNELFADYAIDLIDGMLGQIHVDSPADYEKGIAGIGVGIDYLIQNGFLCIEDDICEDLDSRMMRAVMYDFFPGFSLYSGLTGYGRYWITRLRYHLPSVQARECLLRIVALIQEMLSEISVEEQMEVYCFLYDLQKISSFNNLIELLDQCLRIWGVQSSDIIRNFPRLEGFTVSDIIRSYHYYRCFNNASLQDEIDVIIKRIPVLNMEKSSIGLGLITGYAGEGMLRLTAMNHRNTSWMSLL